jgi:hypothetical protein
MMTSSEGLRRVLDDEPLLKEYAKKGLPVRILAPIISENHEFARRLLKYSEVRHVPTTYFETTIIDRKHVFQIKNHIPEQDELKGSANLENTFYSDDVKIVEKTLNALESVWKNAPPTPSIPLITVLNPKEQTLSSHAVEEFKTTGREIAAMHSQLRCTAVITPPKHLNLPTVIVDVNKAEDQSTFGSSVSMIVFLRVEIPSTDAPIQERYRAIPVAILETNPHPTLMMVTKTIFAGTPAEHNFILVKPEELELYRRGDTVFSGWTISIPLPSTSTALPPSCIMFEKSGNLKHLQLAIDFPSGYKVKQEQDYYDAFLSYVSPLWNYAGSGIEGMFCTDVTRHVFTVDNAE